MAARVGFDAFDEGKYSIMDNRKTVEARIYRCWQNIEKTRFFQYIFRLNKNQT